MFRFVSLKRKELSTALARTAENFFKDNFRKQGFLDESLEAWAKRAKNKDAGRAILVKTGFLRRSIKAVKVTDNHIRIQSNAKYATYHNEGIGHKKRKFVGVSSQLNKLSKEVIKKALKSVFK